MGTGDSARRRVVLAHPPERRLLAGAFADAGFEVGEAATAADCLDRLAGDRADGIVTGYDLPDSDGIELLETIRERYPSLPVVVFAAAGSERIAGEAVAAGADGYVPGGEPVATVVERLEDCIRAARTDDENRRRYRNLVESAPVPINLFDEKGRTVWGNDAVLDLLGIEDRDDLIGRSIFEFIHPDDRDLAEDELAEVIERGNDVGPSYMRLVRTDGETRHVRVSTAAGRYEGERVGQAVVVDVTPIRRAESELRVERDFVRQSLDELRDVFCFVAPSGALRRWNARLADVTGRDDAALEDATLTDLVPPSEEHRVEDAVATAIETGTSFVAVNLLTDGDRRRYEFRAARLTGSDGDVRGVVAIGRDVTERERMQRELRENEQRYRTLVEMSPEPVLVHRDGDIVYVNDAAVALVDGGSRAELLGTPVTRFLEPEARPEAEAAVRETQRGRASPTRNERTVVTLEGRKKHVETTSRPIAYEGEPAVLTVVKDVTDRRRHERTLTRLHERTREMTRADDRAAVARIATRTADELLDLEGAIVYEFDDGLSTLSRSEAVAERVEDLPGAIPEEGPLWEAFLDGEDRVWRADSAGEGDDESRDGDANANASGSPAPGIPFDTALVVPLGTHGVFVTGTTGGSPLPASRREAARLIAGNLEAALDRVDRTETLRERDRQLEERNESLVQLNRLNEITREITQALVRATTREEIEEQVCERLADPDGYAFAWLATLDEVDGGVEPRRWAGVDAGFLDALASGDASPLTALADEAVRSRSVRVQHDVLDDPDWEPHRREALSHGYRSVAAVPIVRDTRVDGVLVIHASERTIFDDRERPVLAELGRTIGYALHNVERVEALSSDRRTELELRIEDEGFFANRLATGTGARIEFVGGVGEGADELRLFVRVRGLPPGEVESRLDGQGGVEDVRPLSEGDDGGLYQLTVPVPPLLSLLRRTDARLRTLVAEDGASTLTVDLAPAVEVRQLMESVRSRYPGAELLARRERAEPIDTRETFHDRLRNDLTDRQLEALRVAHYGGFYEWPRESTAQQLATTLDIASSTYQYHLRAAERKLIASVLGSRE